MPLQEPGNDHSLQNDMCLELIAKTDKYNSFTAEFIVGSKDKPGAIMIVWNRELELGELRVIMESLSPAFIDTIKTIKT